MNKYSEVKNSIKVTGLELKSGSKIEDYSFKFAYVDAIGRTRLVFECNECGATKEVSDETVIKRRYVNTFRHNTDDNGSCKVYKCNKFNV